MCLLYFVFPQIAAPENEPGLFSSYGAIVAGNESMIVLFACCPPRVGAGRPDGAGAGAVTGRTDTVNRPLFP